MDGWGSLTMLIKRQEAEKNRKTKLKYELQKRREKLLSNSEKKLKFPKVSDEEMGALKAKIRKKYKVTKIKSFVFNIVLLIAVLLLFFYLYTTIRMRNL